ncbi:MAG: DUF5050 domain-containing protein [Butyrivibrio sp.]|nr:DUF5050 domain-containing protein [Butyrivibrio sp.]
MSKKVLIFIILGLVLVGLGIGVTVSILGSTVPKNPDGTVGGNAGNLHNGGLVHEMDGKVYFSNLADGECMYVMNVDETNPKKLTEMRTYSICGIGNYLFFHQDSLKGNGGGTFGGTVKFYGVFRSKTNGKDVECLYRDTIDQVQLIDNRIYFRVITGDRAGLNSVAPNGTDNRLDVPDQISPVCAQDGIIYYTGTTNDHSLHRYNTRTGSTGMILGGSIWYPIIQGDTVYYIDAAAGYHLCRASLGSGNVQTLTYDRVDSFNMTSNRIYYSTSQEGDQSLKTMSLDGSNCRILAPGIYANINLTSQYLYCTSPNTPDALYHYPLNGNGGLSLFQAQ